MVTNFFAQGETEHSDALLERLRVATAGLYDVAGEIGRGGMAIVYIATDMRLGRKVAIKVMEPRLSFTPGMAERFLQEARIAAQLQHHNIIVVHEVQQDGDLIFFVMRLVEGGSLDEVCRRLAQKQQLLPLDQAQWILWQSARALAYAHSEGIVHRDVKPANILVTTKGEVVVTDFGIAKAADAEGLTKSGMAIGTPTYMSPEQFSGAEPMSGAADQYALGIAAFELLTGAPPFTGDLYQMIAAHGSTTPPDVRERRPDCPAPLAEAIARMLSKRSADRFPSLDAVLPLLGEGLSIDGSSTRSGLAEIATALQQARAESVAAWGAVAPSTPPWTSGSRRRTGPVPARISVSPPHGQVVVGGTLALRAVVQSDGGKTIGDAGVRWSSADSSLATVSAEGVVTGVRAGSVTVRAEVEQSGASGAVQAEVQLEITARQVARVRITEHEQSLECGEAMLLTAEAFDGAGQSLGDADIQWSSSMPDVVHVDSRGTIMALAGGVATIIARVGGVQGTIRVEVREAPVGAVTLTLESSEVEIGAAVPLRLAVTDVSGLPRSAEGLRVVSDAPQVAEVEEQPLLLRAKAAGEVRIRVIAHAEGGRTTAIQQPWATATLLVRAPAPVVAPAASMDGAVAPARELSAPSQGEAVPPTRQVASALGSGVAPMPEGAVPPTREAPRPPATVGGASAFTAPAMSSGAPASRRSPMLLWGGLAAVATAAVLAIVLSGGEGGSAASGGAAADSAEAALAAAALAAGSDMASAAEAGSGPAAVADGGAAADPDGRDGARREGDNVQSPDGAGATGAAAGASDGASGQRPGGSAAGGGGATGARDAQAPQPPRSGGSASGGAASDASNTRGAPPPSSGAAPRETTPVERSTPPAAVADSTAGTPPAGTAPPPVAAPAAPALPADADVQRLATAYAARLTRGEFRNGPFEEFFSNRTTEHRAQTVGAPRQVGPDGDALRVDIVVQLDRTLGSGNVQRRFSTVQLLLRGAGSDAVIVRATPGALRNNR